MSFATLEFLAFFAVIFVLYYSLPKRRQWQLLLLGSAFFYWFAGWYCLIYIGVTTLSTYFCAKKIDSMAARQDAYIAANKAVMDKDARRAYKAAEKKKRRLILICCLVFNFGILGFVKYTGFVLSIFNISFMSIALPMGISFYTFQSMGYIIDVFWGKTRAQQDLGKFALFVSFFPQLIQGPISRYGDLSATLYAEHDWDQRKIETGLTRVLWGLTKKLVIADRIAIPLKTMVSAPEDYTGAYVLCVVFFYAAQLYADFTGGIDMTIGMANMFGIELTENFERPFFSKNTAEYWRRWHITMGSWFRDYVFYPVSVSKWMIRVHQTFRAKLGDGIGKRLSIYISSIILWAVTGIWHGASWNFLVWGLLNGAVIIISQELEPLYARFHRHFPSLKKSRVYDAFQILRTFVLMSFIRVLDVYRDVPLTFRQVGTIITAGNFSVLFNGSLLDLGLDGMNYIIAGVGILAMFAVSLLGRRKSVRSRLADGCAAASASVWGLLVLICIVFGIYGIGYDASSFIYNQF